MLAKPADDIITLDDVFDLCEDHGFELSNPEGSARILLEMFRDALSRYGTPRHVLVEVGERLPACVVSELAAAKAKFPLWPTDPIHAAAIVAEESGELSAAVLQVTYEPGKATMADVAKEACQVVATGLRFIASMDRYVLSDGLNQHNPEEPEPHR